MKLTTPTKTTEGFKIGFSTKSVTPELQYDGTKWIITTVLVWFSPPIALPD